jgi:hypothetical protein
MTTYSYTDLSDPFAAKGTTVPQSINDAGLVVGYYFNGTSDVGFLYNNSTYTTLSDPAAGPNGATYPISINDKGEITGSYSNGNSSYAFIYSNGTWSTLSDPAGPGGISPLSINNRGQIIGFYLGNSSEGFFYDNGTWTTLSDPAAKSNPSEGTKAFTEPQSINDAGQITGLYFDGTTEKGFIYSDGTYTNLSDPSVGSLVPTVPASINDAGQVTGVEINGSFPPGFTPSGFIYNNGRWTHLVDPSAGDSGTTWPVSMNNRGQVIGYFYAGSTESTLPEEGFLYTDGSWTTLNDPSSGPNGQTIPQKINDAGQIIGDYLFFNTSTQSVATVGFLATPHDVDKRREPPKLTITDHSLSLSAGGTISLPISVSPNDADDTVSVKISGLPSFETITAGDGHTVVKIGNSYTFTLADVQSGLTLHSSFDQKNHPSHDGPEHDRDEGEHSEHRLATEQTKLIVTAINRTHGEYAATNPETITVSTTPPTDRLVGLFNQYVAGFHNEGIGETISSPEKQQHQENLPFLSSPHH